jgi:hypothetical protein
MLDWQRLGLEAPTNDAVAIRRAYAVKLRSTRPDDDAAAYQALREAYDRLLLRARHRPAVQPQEASRMPEAAEPAGPGSLAPQARPQARPEEDPESVEAREARRVPPMLPPEALCRLVLQVGQQQGAEGLVALLPELTRLLHALPLQAQTEASVRFAELVIHTRGLPDELLRLLLEHFAWLDDFRTARLLGMQRAEALRQALDSVLREVTDPRILQTNADAMAFDRLLSQGHYIVADLVATLMGFLLQRQIERAGPALLRRLGMDHAQQTLMANTLSQGQWIRTGALVLCLLGIGFLLGADAGKAFSGTFFGVALGLIGTGLAARAMMILQGVRQRGVLPPRWSAKLRLHRLRAAWPWIGVVMLVLASAGIAAAADRDSAALFIAAALCGLVGAALAVPTALDQAVVAMALVAYAGISLRGAPLAAALLATAWVLGCMQMYLQGAHRPLIAAVESKGWNRSSLTAVAASVALGVVGLPIVAAWATERAGARLVLSALLLAVSPPLMGSSVASGPALWLTLPFTLPALLIAQLLSFRLGRWLAARFSR